MSEILKTPCTNEDEAISARKTVRKVVIDDSDDDLVEEVLDDISEEEFAGDRTRCQRREARYEDLRARRRIAGGVSVHSVVGGGVRKNFHITCLVCQRKITCADAKCSLSAYYICEKCMDGEKEQTRGNEGTSVKNNEKTRSLPVSGSTETIRDCSYCRCQNCTRRQKLEEEREREIEMLQSCWHDLRQNIRQMFRDGLDATATSLKGKKFDVEKIKRNVAILTEKDPHQLYKRLESIGHEYVMNLKSDDLWQILVVPQVVPALIELFESGASEEKMELERAKLFIKSLLDRFSCQQETARNMSPLLAALDEEYLTQFGISWKIINHHIFDCVIYQDDLLINYLPSMEKVLKCQLIISDESDEERAARERREAARTDIPPGALELAQSFRVFHKLMVTSREIFKKANANIALFAEQQNIIHHITRKAKSELLEDDLEFFKSQRRMMRNCASKRQHCRWRDDFPACARMDQFFNDEDDNTDSEADAADFSKRLHELIDEGPAASICIDQSGKVAPSMECRVCSVRHCSCDECRISHIITCGLLDQVGDFSTNLIWNKSQTGLSDKGEDKDCDSENSGRRKSSPSGCSQRPVRRSLRFQAARALFTLHDHYNKKEIAWGDWQVPYSFSHDLDYDDHCLNENSDLLKDSKGTKDLFDESDKFNKDGFIESEAFVAAIKDVAEQIGYDIQESVIGKAKSRSWDFYDLTKFGFDLNREVKTQIKSHLSALFKPKTSPTEEDTQNDIEKKAKEKKFATTEWTPREPRSSSSTTSSTSKTTETRGISRSSAASNSCNVGKDKRAKKTVTDVSSSEEESETDSESPSPSLAGTADWSQIRLVNDTILDSKTLDEYCSKAPLSESDRLILKEVTQRQLAVLSSNENTVSGIALELFGKKVMEKPQLAAKAQTTPSVTRIIRKLKANAERCDSVANGAIVATPKPLAASAKERLLQEMRELQKKTQETGTLFTKTYEGEKWTPDDNFKVHVLGKVNDCLANEWSNAEGVTDLKNAIMTTRQQNNGRCKSESTDGQRSESVATEKTESNKAVLENNGMPETSNVAKTKKEGTPQGDRAEKMARTRAKQQGIMKQLNELKAVADGGKASSASDKKAKTSGCCLRSSKPGANEQKQDANSLSTTVDFNVDLNDFDFRSFSSEMAKKLREGGKLDKLIAQAVGMGATKMALSGKLEYKCEDVKRLGYCEQKEGILGYHSDNDIEDLSDDDEVDSGDNWSDCEPIDNTHPYRHHSCDNKKKVERTASGSRKDTRSGHAHCDCCYCEMFGHSAADSTKTGRVPQIRERLRLKLKRRIDQEAKCDSQSNNRISCSNKEDAAKTACSANAVSTETKENGKHLTVANAPIEEILEYINEKDNAAAQAAANKAAKRARQKQRKQEEKERLEMERRKQEELKRAQEEEELLKKKEKQAAQQAASREKALKAEEKKRKAAEDRARAQRRQKELREQERQQQHAKEQERLRKLQEARQAAAKKAAEEREALKKAKTANLSSDTPSKQVESDQTIKEVSQKPHVQTTQKSHSMSCSPLPANNDRRPPSAPSSIPAAQLNTVSKADVSLSEQKKQKVGPDQLLQAFSQEAVPLMRPLPTEPTPLPRPPGISLPGRRFQASAQLDERSLYAAFKTQPSLSAQLCATGDQSCADLGYSGFNPSRGGVLTAGVPSTAVFHENSFTALNPRPSPAAPFDPRPMSAAPYVVPSLSTAPYYNGNVSPLSSMATRMPRCAQAMSAPTRFATADGIAQRQQQQVALQTSNGHFCTSGRCAERPCSSSSSASSSLCSTSAQHFERLPYTALIAPAGGKCVEKSTAFRLGGGYLSETSSPSASLPQNALLSPSHASNNDTYPLNMSSVLGSSDPQFTTTPSWNNCHNFGVLQQGTPTMVNGSATNSSQVNGEMRTKCGETCSAFVPLSSVTAAPNPLATYESETKTLAAVAEQNNVFSPALHPMVYEPGDPRIAAAVASLQYDPHETFKPRPENEVQFLDPLEQEIEYFKRVMWEERSSSRPRIPLREISRIEPENDENAVFHFDPLV
uniref:EF-hand domain-containing protein n=1 Tax=Ascaris lumbricoides TaxID=6252 RepID=A0A9J2NZD8_ASCLU